MVLAKLDRARFHPNEFDAKWDWYYHSGAYRYDMRMDDQSPHVLRFWWDLPDRTAEQARAVSITGGTRDAVVSGAAVISRGQLVEQRRDGL